MKIKEVILESTLREFVESDEVLNMLIQTVQNTDNNDPAHQSAMKLVHQLIQLAKDPAAPVELPDSDPKVKSVVQPSVQPVAQKDQQVVAEAKKLIPAEQAAIDELKKLAKTPKLKAILDDPDVYKIVAKIYNQGIEQGKNIQHQLQLEWGDDLAAQAAKLANKVYNNAQVIHSAIQTNQSKDGTKEQLDEAKESGTEIRSKIVDILKTMFDRPVRSERDRQAVEAMKRHIKDFMTKCETGVIDFHKVLANRNPNAKIDDFVQGPDQKIYRIIRNEAFEAKPGVTGGAWGPGEIGLALLSSPVTKGSKGGDLKVYTAGGTIDIELKGMKNAKKGGRFNSDKGIVKASQAGARFEVAVQELVNDLSTIIQGNEGEKQTPKELFSWKQANGKMKNKNPRTFDLEALTNVYNPKLIVPSSQIDPIATKYAVKEFLKKTIMEVTVLEGGKKFATPHTLAMLKDPSLFEQVGKNGFQLNFTVLQSYVCRILYAVYSGLDEKGVIMYFNTLTSNYYVVKGPEDVQEKIQSGLLTTGNDILNFAAGQVPASPQVGIA